MSEDDKNLPEKPKRKRMGAKQASEVRSYNHFTPTKRNKFLKTLERTGNKNSAAAHAGVSRATVYALMSRNESFRAKVEMAHDKHTASLEEEVMRRAVDGVDEDIYFKGKVVGSKKNFSDALLQKVLEAADPERYGKRSNVNIEQNINVSDSAKAKLAAMLDVKLDDAIDADYEEVDKDEE